jgi:uncharacterized protein YkwD
MWKSLCVYVLALCLVLISFPVSAQEPDLIAQWLAQVNQARLDGGLAPYKRSEKLTVAAQRHADDVAAHGFANPGDVHLGSDGTHEQERVVEAGYAAWTWNGGGLVVDENMATYDTIATSMEFFLNSAVHRNNILNSQYREVGIGVSTDDGGGYYHVLVFSVRPNVLPIFINDDAATTDNSNVAIRLTNEEARPDGEGVDKVGQAIEVRVGDDREWDDQPWQPWDTYVPWTLPETSGEHTVYVQFRDAAGRTTESADTIVLEGEGLVEPTPLPPTATSTPEPTETPIPPTNTPEPTATPVPTILPEPTIPLEPTSTFTPEPPPTVALTPTPVVPSPQAGGPTPFPTWTPLPTLEPPQPSENQPPFYLLAALQGVVLLFGLYLVLRRGRGGESRDASDTPA